jgi:alanine dehydrogenase
MRFGVVRETLPGERRVPLTPEGARVLVARNHLVVVEANVGAGSGFSDTEYLAAGATVAYTSREVAAEAEFVLKVHPPTAEEVAQLRPGTTLMAFLHLAGQPAAVHAALAHQGCSTLSMELVREGLDEYPLLEPLSAIGGRVAATLAAWHLTQPGNGPGILLGGSPGVPPAVVLVIGGGTAGTAAAAGCAAHGAQVVVLDLDPRRLARVERILGRTVITAVATEFHLARFLEQADVVIGAVAVRGEPSPRVLRRSHIRSMKEGALFIDMSIDEGGCAETSRPTAADEPPYECEGVRHICIPNLPSEVARTASRAMAASLLPYLQPLGSGLHHALARNPALRHAVGFLDGKLVNRTLRRFVAAPYVALDEIVRPVED